MTRRHRARYKCECGHLIDLHRPTTDCATITWHCVPGCLCIGYGSGEYVVPDLYRDTRTLPAGVA